MVKRALTLVIVLSILFCLPISLHANESKIRRPQLFRNGKKVTVGNLEPFDPIKFPFQHNRVSRERLTSIQKSPIHVKGEPIIQLVPEPSGRSESNKQKELIYQEGELLVKFKEGITIESINTFLAQEKLTLAKRFKILSQLKGQHYAHILTDGKKGSELAEQLQKSPLIEAVSLNYIKHPASADCLGNIPNDPFFDFQWSLCNNGQMIPWIPDADIDATEAWAIQTGSSDVVVAVIDSGVNYLHPDLVDNMWVNPGEIPGDGIDNDLNGYVDDVHGIDTAMGDSDPFDDKTGHGTLIAGIIGGKGNNSWGIAGINWNVKIMALKGFSDYGMKLDAEVKAIEYIIAMKQRGVNVVAINASYGCYWCYSELEKDLIEAAGDEGIILVASAGNDAHNNDECWWGECWQHFYPSDYDLENIMSVAASNWYDVLSDYSNYGEISVDLAAPGDFIFSSYQYWFHIPTPGDPFFDDMESGKGNWEDHPQTTWEITDEQYLSLSPYHAWSDSPYGDYSNNAINVLISRTIDLSGVTGEDCLTFHARHDLEEGFDWMDIAFYRPPTGPEWQITDEIASSGDSSWSVSPDGDYSNDSQKWLISPMIDLSSAFIPSVGWQLTNEMARSGFSAWSDSPGGNYPDGSDNWLESPVIDLSGAAVFGENVELSFWLTGIVEEGCCDYLYIAFSPDGGWSYYFQIDINGDFTSDWHQISLEIPSDFLTDKFRVAFILSSDLSDTADGYYIDDVCIFGDSGAEFFSDDMESGEGGWVSTQYGGIGGILDFMLTGMTEEWFDELMIIYSPDDGFSWYFYDSISGDFSDGWYQLSLPIPTFLMTSGFRLIFGFLTDESIAYDGYHIDDVCVKDFEGTTFFSDDMESGEDGWLHFNSGVASFAGSITGSSYGNWYRYTIPIDERFYTDQFGVHFVLFSDETITGDGVYLDNIGIGDGELINTYAFGSGTSMAAPHVTGAAALVAAQRPMETAVDCIGRILDGVDPLSSLSGLVATGGRLNLYNSLNKPPVSDAGENRIVEANRLMGAEVGLDGSGSSDPDGDPLIHHWTWPGGSATGVSPIIQLPLGTTVVTLVVNDGIVDSEPDPVTINVQDTTPPEVTLSIRTDSLWPPNHDMVDVGFGLDISDVCDPEPVVSIHVTSDEPTATAPGAGGPAHAPDAEITDDGGVLLRAERSGESDGRVYAIAVTATDVSGNMAYSDVSVKVNHDAIEEANDSGQNYDATQIN